MRQREGSTFKASISGNARVYGNAWVFSVARHAGPGAHDQDGQRVDPPTVTTTRPATAEPSDNSRTSHPTLSSWSHWALFPKKFPHQSRR